MRLVGQERTNQDLPGRASAGEKSSRVPRPLTPMAYGVNHRCYLSTTWTTWERTSGTVLLSVRANRATRAEWKGKMYEPEKASSMPCTIPLPCSAYWLCSGQKRQAHARHYTLPPLHESIKRMLRRKNMTGARGASTISRASRQASCSRRHKGDMRPHITKRRTSIADSVELDPLTPTTTNIGS